MTVILWIAIAIVALYLLLVIPAGLAVLVTELRFRKAPDRSTVLEIIEEYRQELSGNEQSLLEVVRRSRRDILERHGVRYSVAVDAKTLRSPRSYKVSVSVGTLRLITIGHAESFEVSFE